MFVSDEVAARNARGRESFAAIETDPITFIKGFYGTLFERAPHLRRMFPADLTQQARKLHETLASALGELDYLDRALTILMAQGAQHARKGVVPEHYPLVAEALVTALARGSRVWSTAHEAAWRDVLRAVSEAMLAGARMEHVARAG